MEPLDRSYTTYY